MIASALALLVSLTAAAEPPADVAAQVNAYLGAIDRPVTAETWRALGPAAVPALEEALRGDPMTSRRAAAAAGLAAIGGARAEALLLEAAADEAERWPVRRAAVRGAPSVIPPERLLAALEPVMARSRAPAVRALAAEVVAHHATGGCAAVRAQVAREPRASRGGFGRALARCESPR